MGTKRGRYVKRSGDIICEQIALGHTLKYAIETLGYLAPSIPQFWKWIDNYPEFREQYERARQLAADVQADKVLELSQEVLEKPRNANAFKVAIDVLKWQAEVRNTERYGKRQAIQVKREKLDPAKLRAEIKRLESELGVAEKKVTPLKSVG